MGVFGLPEPVLPAARAARRAGHLRGAARGQLRGAELHRDQLPAVIETNIAHNEADDAHATDETEPNIDIGSCTNIG